MLSPALMRFAQAGQVLAGGPPSPTTDTHLALFLRADTGVTFDGSNLVYGTSSWLDQSGNNRHMSNTSSHKCDYLASAINGKPAIGFTIARASNMVSTSFGIAHPFTYFFLLRTPTWGNQRFITENVTGNFGGTVYQDGVSPKITMYSGAGAGDPSTTGVPVNTWKVLTTLFNGASSKICVDKGSDTTGSTGTTGLSNGISIGGDAAFSHLIDMDIAAIILTDNAADASQRLLHVNWLSDYGGLGL